MKADMEGLNDFTVQRLARRDMRIASAESCTGGLFASLITEVPGASEIFNESIVTYSNEAKMRELGVKSETLKEYGAVSRNTAKQMCEGICVHTGADVGISITGIAGPQGGTKEKPVGTVFVGICIKGLTRVYHLLINGSREQVREETCRFVFEKLLELIP